MSTPFLSDADRSDLQRIMSTPNVIRVQEDLALVARILLKLDADMRASEEELATTGSTAEWNPSTW